MSLRGLAGVSAPDEEHALSEPAVTGLYRGFERTSTIFTLTSKEASEGQNAIGLLYGEPADTMPGGQDCRERVRHGKDAPAS